MVYVQTNDKVKKIIVESTLSSSDTKELLDELKASGVPLRTEITFSNLEILPENIIIALSLMKKNIDITTTQKSLWSYLSKLGIVSEYSNSLEDLKKRKKEIKAIVIGGSAGSIEKMLPIVKAIPFTDISLFVVIHILPNKASHLVEIIQNVTRYKVLEASNNLQIEKGYLYIAKPNAHMVITDGYLYLDYSKEENFARPSIDRTFKSLSYYYKESLTTIVLCGYGDDGSHSLEELHKLGSEVIIEDPKECEAKSMPSHAIATGFYNKVFDDKTICEYLKISLGTHLDIQDEIISFLDHIKLVYNHDFRSYDHSSLIRRIAMVMQENSIKDFKTFKHMVFDDVSFFKKLLRAFSINVTDFFRNPEVFKGLKKEVLPYLESFSSIRVWCAGCSRGNEPYSVAMVLDEMGLLSKSQIYATDFNETILQEAKNGMYPFEVYEQALINYNKSEGTQDLTNWFDVHQHFVQVKKYIRDKVVFFKHNLVEDASINEFHLIFCRNVLIYFNSTLQKRVFSLLDESLFRNSFMVLGESEVLPSSYNFKVYTQKNNKIYKKVST